MNAGRTTSKEFLITEVPLGEDYQAVKKCPWPVSDEISDLGTRYDKTSGSTQLEMPELK